MSKTPASQEKKPKTPALFRGSKGQVNPEWLLWVLAEVSKQDGLDLQLREVVNVARDAVNATRGSLFMFDDSTNELYTRIADGMYRREIRISSEAGIAGSVYSSGNPEIVLDVSKDPRFLAEVDKETGFVTKDMIAVPVRTLRGNVIGVAQMLNKVDGAFDKSDLKVLEALTQNVAIVLHGSTQLEASALRRKQESEMLDVVSEASTEIHLGPLLNRIIGTVSRMLNCERSTLFLNDPKSKFLYTEVGQGLGVTRIRFPNHLGIAGAVFTDGKTINIPYAYADLRFNPAFDKQTGFFTRSILCVPVVNKNGDTIGVTQALNKIGGVFTEEDEQRLRAFTAQIAIALENAKLFDDVQTVKNYNESMLESMSNGVLTVDDKGNFGAVNAAAQRILRKRGSDLIGTPAIAFFNEENQWVSDCLGRVQSSGVQDIVMDAEILVRGSREGEVPEKMSVNLTVQTLKNNKQETIGNLMLIEDISSEKRVKATMARYMDPALADKLIAGGEEILGGASSEATVLFSDIRSFTTLTEQLGPQGTVALLNEYFTLMVDCITFEGGMLDKFIGDAIMCVFGTPFPHDDDEDRAVRAGIAMLRSLNEFNVERATRGLMAVDMGLGINTDNIVSGNIGSPKRMDYTVIGDGVNLASRLEGACKTYSTKMLISDNTYRRLRGSYRCREVDWVIVKGKTEPVGVVEVLDWHTEESFPNVMDTIGLWKMGLDQYRKGNFSDAMLRFEETLKVNPKDKLCHTYIERCVDLMAENPKDWDGIYTMKSK
jgi:adenylate cyclase